MYLMIEASVILQSTMNWIQGGEEEEIGRREGEADVEEGHLLAGCAAAFSDAKGGGGVGG